MKSISIRIAACLFLYISSWLPCHASDQILHPNDVIALCGDSITAQQMYSTFLEEYFLVCQPVPGIRGVNLGAGGHMACHFNSRIENDILPFHPTIATVCFGMNDSRFSTVQKENEEEYIKGLNSAFEKLKAAGVRTIIVGGPGIVDPGLYKGKPGGPADETDAGLKNAKLKSLSEIARNIAAQHGYPFADVHQAMLDTLSKTKAAAVPLMASGDGCHPTPSAHLAMAYAFLKAFGVSGEIGKISVDLASGRATGTEGQEIVSVKNGNVDVRSSRYPFCFVGDIDARSLLPYIPFNQDFNRYILVVTGLGAPKASVTWGKTTKEYSASDLEKGINLAAEFLDNPFCGRFLAMQEAVQAKNKYENTFSFNFVRMVPRLAAEAPEQKVALAKANESGIALQRQLSDLAAGFVVPVNHTISIKPLR